MILKMDNFICIYFPVLISLLAFRNFSDLTLIKAISSKLYFIYYILLYVHKDLKSLQYCFFLILFLLYGMHVY